MSKIIDRLEQLQKELKQRKIKPFSFKSIEVIAQKTKNPKWTMALGGLILVSLVGAIGFVAQKKLFFSKKVEKVIPLSRAQLDLQEIKKSKEFLSQGEWQKAKTLLKPLLDRDVSVVDLYVNWATVLNRQGQTQQAIDFLLKVNEKFESQTILNNIGVYYQQLGLYKLAEEFLLKAIEKNPKNFEVVLNVAILYEKQKRWRAAQSYYEVYLNGQKADAQLKVAIEKRLYKLHSLHNFNMSKGVRYEIPF